MTVRCWYISNICHTQTLFPTENTADAGLFIILTDLLDPGDRLPALRDPVDEGGRGGAGLVLPSLPHKLPHRDHPGHRDASQGWTFFLSTVHCSARAILSQHLLHRRKNSAQIFFGENFTTSSCDGGRSSTEARRALLRPLLVPSPPRSSSPHTTVNTL